MLKNGDSYAAAIKALNEVAGEVFDRHRSTSDQEAILGKLLEVLKTTKAQIASGVPASETDLYRYF